MANDLYEDAELYEAIFLPEPFATYYCAVAVQTGGPVLELACGTGQIILSLIDHGIQGTGLDLSGAMLQYARSKAAKVSSECCFVEKDMRDFSLEQQFPLIFIARNSLLHLTTNEDLRKCLRCVRTHLAPGGTFAFDVFNPSPKILAQPSGQRSYLMQVRHPKLGDITIENAPDYDNEFQINRATWFFSRDGHPDFLRVPLHLRCIFPQELVLLLELEGFELVQRYGTFDRQPFEHDSQRQICLARVRHPI